MTKPELCGTIIALTDEIKATGLSEELFNAARSGDVAKVEEVFWSFRQEHGPLCEKLNSLKEELVAETDYKKLGIFGLEEGEEEFDPKKISVLDFEVLMFFLEVDDIDLFDIEGYEDAARASGETDPSAICDAGLAGIEPIYDELDAMGYPELAEYFSTNNWMTDAECIGKELYQLLVDIFADYGEETEEDDGAAQAPEESEGDT